MDTLLFDIITAPWRTAVLFAAVRLNIFTRLSDQTMSVDEIAAQCGARAHLLGPLLGACAGMGLLDCRDGTYMNSSFSRLYLVEGEPLYMGDFVKLLHRESDRWNTLYDLLVDGGGGTEDAKAQHRIFIRGMHNIGSAGEAEALCNAVDLSGCARMIDAGGGSGLYSIVLCRRYPELHSIILDKRETLAVTREIVAGCAERERIQLREADIVTEPFGEGIDVVLLSDVLYDRTLAGPLLGNAANSLKAGGLLIIRGYYTGHEAGTPLFGALFVLGQLVFDPAREVLTLPSLRDELREAGFTDIEVSLISELSYALISRKG